MSTTSTSSPITQELRAEKVQQYTPLVRYVISRLAIRLPNVLDYEDIVSYGTVGLIEAIDRYDDSKGVKFETYAISRIRGAIIDAMRALDRLPRSTRQKARMIDSATNTLTHRLGRQPTEHEVAAELGIPIDRYRKTIVDTSWVTISLDVETNRDDGQDGTTMEAIIADPDAEDVTADLTHRETLEEVVDAIKLLPEREALLLSLYYKEGLTMREIADILGISESRVCQLHARALTRLRNFLTEQQAA